MKFKAVNKNKHFIRAYKRGDSYIYPSVVVYVFRQRYGGLRIGITSSKKIGCAVKRNRARRVVREAVRSLALDMNKNYDLIFVCRGRTAREKPSQIAPLIKQRLVQAGVIDAQADTDISDKVI